MKKHADLIVQSLKQFNPVIKQASSGSIYIALEGSKVREIRVANHAGHKLKRRVWELRTDAMTKRGQFNRVYNVRDIHRMIGDVK